MIIRYYEVSRRIVSLDTWCLQCSNILQYKLNTPINIYKFILLMDKYKIYV